MSAILKQFMNFDKFLTTQVLRVVYLIGMALIGLFVLLGFFGGIIGCVSAIANGNVGEAVKIFFAPVILLLVGALSAILWRVYCEILIVIFKINDNIQALRDASN